MRRSIVIIPVLVSALCFASCGDQQRADPNEPFYEAYVVFPYDGLVLSSEPNGDAEKQAVIPRGEKILISEREYGGVQIINGLQGRFRKIKWNNKMGYGFNASNNAVRVINDVKAINGSYNGGDDCSGQMHSEFSIRLSVTGDSMIFSEKGALNGDCQLDPSKKAGDGYVGDYTSLKSGPYGIQDSVITLNLKKWTVTDRYVDYCTEGTKTEEKSISGTHTVITVLCNDGKLKIRGLYIPTLYQGTIFVKK